MELGTARQMLQTCRWGMFGLPFYSVALEGALALFQDGYEWNWNVLINFCILYPTLWLLYWQWASYCRHRAVIEGLQQRIIRMTRAEFERQDDKRKP